MRTLYFLPVLLLVALFPSHSISQIQFSPYIAIPTGSSPEVVAIADVNNDGLQDVVVGNSHYFDPANDYRIFVYLQNASGNLDEPIKYPYTGAISGVNSIDIADVNNDNLNDVIIGYDGIIGIYHQNSSAALNPVQVIQTGTDVRSLKVGDLNEDGLNDIAMACSGANILKIYTQNANGIFTSASYGNSGFIYSEIHIADMNDDGKKDVVCMSGAESINIFTQNESGLMNAPVTYANTSMHGIAVGDLNNDGNTDIAASKGGNSPSSKVAIWLQNANTNLLQTPTELSAYDIPEPIEIADLNNDGKNEIITVHGGWMKMTVYEQNNNVYNTYSGFSLPYASHYEEQGFSVGDINNDGAKDIAIADYNYGLVILYNISELGVADIDTDRNGITLYPNPTRNLVNVHFSDASFASQSTTRLYNSLGAFLEVKSTSENTTEFDLTNYPQGLYFIEIETHDATVTKKIMKQ